MSVCVRACKMDNSFENCSYIDNISGKQVLMLMLLIGAPAGERASYPFHSQPPLSLDWEDFKRLLIHLTFSTYGLSHHCTVLLPPSYKMR